jgi:hypothetical protein
VTQAHALLLTIAVEVPVGLAAFALGPRPVPWLRVLVALLAVSLVTHPVAWWLASDAWRAWAFPLRATAIEGLVVLAETGLLAVAVPLRVPRAAAIALAINATSFAVGYWLTH